MIKHTKELTPETKVGDLQGWAFLSPKQQESQRKYAEKQKHFEYDKRHFTQVNDKECSTIMTTLTLPQAGTLLSMFAYMEKGSSGFLYYDGERLGQKEFAKLIKKSERTVQRNISELVNLGYVTAHKRGRKVCYSINSQIATRGNKTASGYFSRLYFVQLREVIRRATIQELGLFFFMIPHFNTEYYAICENPYENRIGEIELWNREKIAEELGVSLRTVKGLIPSMMRKGFLASVKTWRTAITLHPSLVSRGYKTVTFEDLTKIIENDYNQRVEW
ncbi:ArsR family transcriptional regulator [Virgibacillus halodenitrificans]|uniref:Winged helix-turn-helix transcriptional regulator n=1 Tax=Virgibacillus halodenitrificans TaxID=1482 RepID=A0ABR7VT48_VIRHA|nr:ArsR family transcriptional regulator [Virgibacillus halodenitrificans]MBD1224798.1 winged helix-turn-helix transcriptional regulator [Virgibacillus halodenitrificans]